MENKFNSQTELYNKVRPALRTKRHELYRNGLTFIKEIDIWNYNKEKKWKNAKGLTLASLVDDILNTPDTEYDNYVKEKLMRMNKASKSDKQG